MRMNEGVKVHYIVVCDFFFFFQAEDGIRDTSVTGVQTCALPISLQYARKHGVTTVAITSNRHMAVARLAKIVIALEVGPEVLTGSTRLKAGTSRKMVLNMLDRKSVV